jgi:hypothetical protein
MRRTLVGLVAACLLVAGACGDDDDDTGLGLGQAETNDDGDGGEGDGSGYPEEAQSNFMASCTASGSSTEDQCQCALDEIMAAIPFDEYLAWEQSAVEDPSAPPPAAITDAITTCAAP